MSVRAPRVITLGESMGLIRAEGIGGWEHVAEGRIGTGGAEGNTAIGLARLGAEVVWLGRVGSDALGRRVIGDLRAEGVHVHAVVDDAAPTGLMLKSAPRGGTTVVDYYRRGSAGSRLQPGDLDLLDIADGDIVHLTGVTLALSETARATAFAAIDRAHAAGARVSFAVNHRNKLWSVVHASAFYERVLALADIVFASDDEAQLLRPGSAPEELARALADGSNAEVIVTLGPDGAVAVIDDDLHRVDAVRIDPVDTVGAGDAFAAGYLAERLVGASPTRRLQTAALAGAYACLHPGDWQGAIRRSELDRPTGGDPVAR